MAILPGGLTHAPNFISEFRLSDPNLIGNPCPQQTIFVGENGKRYYVAGGTGGVGGSGSSVYIYNADDGTQAFVKTPTNLNDDAVAAGVAPPGGVLTTSRQGQAAFPVPETPYVVVIGGSASGLDTQKDVLYYKVNSNSALELVGGYAGKGDGLDVQNSPSEASGDSLKAAGLLMANGTSGTNNTIPYKYPIALAYDGEGRANVVVVPSINYIIANTPLTEDIANSWSDKEIDLEGTTFGANIFAITDNQADTRNAGFFLPKGGDTGSYLCLMFFVSDLEAHDAGTETVTNAYLQTNTPGFVTGLISSIEVNLTVDLMEKFGFSNAFGSIRTAFHADFRNSDFSSAFPFSDYDDDFDDTDGLPTNNYYTNPTVYPSDISDPEEPWFLFFPKIYSNGTDKDKIGLRVFAYDPKTGITTFLATAKGQVYTISTEVHANTNPLAANVYWDRNTGQVDLLIRSTEGGAKALIVTTFGTFIPVVSDPGEDLKVRAWTFTFDGHSFYVLRLGEQGTFVYDLATQQWSEFITAGDTTWNAEHGLMWDDRAIALDNSGASVWLIDPDATQDEGSKDITRIVTGGFPLRGRDVVTCDAVKIVASVGSPQIVDATVSLRWSDDNGQTFGSSRSITLVDNDFGQEIVWRALGAMRTPGRVFEITDVGGLVRIDDADIETGADEDD